MTYEECVQGGGLRSYVCSGGESLLWVCRRLYGGDVSVYRGCLAVLNPGLNWFCLRAGDVVYYLDGVVVGGCK